jgi:hypothetical protein
MSGTGSTALYRYFDERDRLLYVGITDNLANRENGHVRSSLWMQLVASSTVKRYPEREHALVAEQKAIKTERPLFNRQDNNTADARERVKAYLKEIGRIDLYDPRKYTVNMPLGELEMMRARKKKPRPHSKPAAQPAEDGLEFEVKPTVRSQVILIAVPALQDDHLSFAARGLLAFVLSLPDDTEITTEWLAGQRPDGREDILATLGELEACGYYRDGIISDGKPRPKSAGAA